MRGIKTSFKNIFIFITDGNILINKKKFKDIPLNVHQNININKR